MSKPMLAALGAVLVAVGFGLGRYATPSVPAPQARSVAPANATHSPSEGSSEAPQDPEAQEKLLADLMRERDPFARVSRLATLLSSWGPDAVPAVESVLRSSTIHVGGAETILLTQFWAAHDPETALDWGAQKAPTSYRQMALFVALEEWAAADPQAVLKKFGEQGYAPFGDAAQIALVRGWFRSGEPGLDEYMHDLGQGAEQQRALAAFAHEMIELDGAEAVQRWAEALPDSDPLYKNQAFSMVGWELTAEDPALGVAWCEKHCDGPLGGKVRQRIAMRWAMQDGRAAIDWIAKAPPGYETDLSVIDIIRFWWARQPESLYSWLDAQDPAKLEPWLKPALAHCAKIIADKDPLKGIEWANTIEDENNRGITLAQIAQKWRKQDRAAADAWLETAPLSEKFRALAVQEKHIPKVLNAPKRPPS